MQDCNLEESSEKDHVANCNEDRDGWDEDLINAISQKVGKLEKDPEKTRLRRIRLCLDEGANINVQDKNGDTVLHVAVKKSYRQIVELCVEKKAKTDIPNHNGETAMKLAETLKNQDILRILKSPIVNRREPQVRAPLGENDPIPIADDAKASKSGDTNVGIRRKSAKTKDDSESIVSGKRPNCVRDENKVEKIPDFEEYETYAAGDALKKSCIGIVYQWKQLAFTLHSALQQKDPYFFLATEMIDAEKLDDVVLLYKNSSGTQVGRFVQIKYTSNQSGRITPQQLLEPDGNFSLLTYFISWRKVKENPLFRKVEVRNMILCTNMGLDLGGLEKNQIYCEEAEEPDKSFELKSRVKKSAWYKLSVDSELNKKLYHELKSMSDVRRLANWTAKCIYQTKSMRLEMGNFGDYHRALATHVFNTKTKQFHDKFVKDEGLSEKARKFRELFLSEFLNMAQPAEKKIFEESPWEEVNKRFQTLDFRQDFGNAPKSQTNPSTHNELPDDCVEDEEISQFLDEFTLAVNQPNEDELTDILRNKIDANSRFNLMNTELLDGTFQTKIFDWFLKKHEQGTRTEYLSYKVGEELLKGMNDMVGSLITVGVNSMQCERMKAHNIRFRQEMQRVTAFSTGDGSVSASERILEVVAPKGTLLTALRVYDTLQKIPKHKKMDSFIFVDIDTLKLPGIQDIVMTTFDSPHYPDLLIVDCGSNRAEKYLQELWESLRGIIAQNVRKMMIIITQAGVDSGAQIDFGHGIFYDRSNEYSFCKLTDDSQKKILARPVTEFQGRESRTSFGELLGFDDFENLSADELENLSGLVDFDTLVELISSNEIKIGSVLEGLGAASDYYIHRRIYQRIIIDEKIFEGKKMSDMIAISGTDGELPKTLTVRMNSVDGDVTNITVLDDTRTEEQFEALCAANVGRNIHWLKKESGIYTWKQSQGNIAALFRYRNVTANDDNDLAGATYLDETELSAHNEPVIISDTAGMGKSTMLISLACRMKKKNQNMLVLRIDLVQHVTVLSELVKDKGNNNLWNGDEAVRFLLNKLVSDKSNFETKLCKMIIEKRRNVALIFDGFDEISPTYEGIVIDLIRGLSGHGIKKLLIATRPHTREALEMELNAFSYKIEPFLPATQVEFLTKFWKKELYESDSAQRTEDRIKRYAGAIMQKLANSIKDQGNILTGLPLQARLVAEIFGDHRDGQREDFDSCKKFVESEVDEPKFPEKLNLIYLYERFIEKKFDILFNKSGGNIANPILGEWKVNRFKQFIDTHKKLALNALFSEDQVRNLLASQQEPSQTDTEVVDEVRTGIITQFIDGRPQFGHRTYAEYFAAKFISEMLRKGGLDESTMEIIIADILLQRDYENVRAFLNCLLSEEHHHTLENRRQWEFYLVDCRSMERGTIFHLAATEGNNCIIKLFLECVDAKSEHRTALIEVKDDSGWTAVHRAARHGHFEAIKVLLERTNLNIVSQNQMGETSPHLAACTGEEVAKYSLEKEVDVNLQNNAGQTPLLLASEEEHLEVVKVLLDKGANVNLQNKGGWTPLLLGSWRGHLEVVKVLLDKGANVNLQDKGGWTPLLSGSWRGHLEVVKVLLDKGANVNLQNKGGWTPLLSGSWRGHLEVVKVLLDKGANVNLLNNAGNAPLFAASCSGHLEVVKVLVDEGADVNLQDNYGVTPLFSASWKGHLEVVKVLLDKGADVNLQKNDGDTPLLLASWKGHLEVVKVLLDKGANVNLLNSAGNAPLFAASCSGHLEVVKVLVDEGADVNLQDNYGVTPLFSASRKGHLEVVKVLLDKGADVNLQNEGGQTPLLLASQEGHLEVVNVLLDKGANVNLLNNDGNAPLLYASWDGHLEVVKVLLDKGADVNLQKNDGNTPLHLASQEGHLEVVNVLLDKGANVNLLNNDGNAPLLYASWDGHLEVVKVLLDKGADVNLQKNDGNTPLLLASQEGHLEVVNVLLDKGANVNLLNNDGNAPLLYASWDGHLEVVKVLLDKGANVNLLNNNGNAPLLAASWKGHLEVVKVLLKKEADVNLQNELGDTPLLSVSREGHLEVVKVLLDKGADVNLQNANGATPLFSVSCNGHLEVVKVLLDKGADIHIRDNVGQTPLHAAAGGGQLEVVKYLLVSGTDMTSQDNFGRMPLQVAEAFDRLDVVEYLRNAGGNVGS